MVIQRTKIEATGEESNEEFWGHVMSVEHNGVTLVLRGDYSGQSWPLPAGPDALAIAPAGPYTLRETGEEIPSVDYVATVVEKAA
jgi:hypothetical protein